MFGFGFIEIILIAVLALIFIGPKQLPEVARVIARLMNEWTRVTREFTSHLTEMRSDLHSHIEQQPTIQPPPPEPTPESHPQPEATEPKKDPL